ncbi:type I restriction-modification system [Geminocystis sp. NIES-3708]|uniref:restriction endonuclease subunit S n=1 Tax=Geminocystis sp. NIES-3708 TaxID=1615909 RepID=UPI0005FC832F|nr:restriction endonuclease subunit S [Geminocystis sp. NIES-3708]BAQ60913.1 type I restriction-modification system [Geminocystis sp. NIES-3708]
MMLSLPKYDCYKDSGVDWLGEIPQTWELTSGRTCFGQQEIKNKGNQETTVLSLSYGNIVIKPEAKLHGLVPESFETYQIVDVGNIIIRSTDLQNDKTSLRVGLVKNKGIITSAYLCFVTNEKIKPEFAYYLLHAYDLLKVYYGMGSGLRQNLSFTDFKYLKLPLPPLEEQERIVKFLDRKCEEVEKSIELKQRLIALLDEQKSIVINQAVTKGLNPNAPMKDSGIDWLGDIPAH